MPSITEETLKPPNDKQGVFITGETNTGQGETSEGTANLFRQLTKSIIEQAGKAHED